MNFKARLFSTFITLSLLITSVSLTAQSDLPEIGSYNPDDVIPMRDDIRTGTLENGITYFILKNEKPDNRVALRMPVKIGSVDEDDDQQGMAHFVEHMCFNGTEDFEKQELINYLEKTGVKFGAHLNAYTSFDETVYMLEMPTDDAEAVENGVKIFENWAHKVLFKDEDIDAERGVVVAEARSRGGAQMRMFEEHKGTAYYKSKYKDRLPIGDTNQIRNAPHENFRRFYNDFYRPELMAVIAVGDIDLDNMESLIKKYFSKIPKSGNDVRQPQEYSIKLNDEPMVSIATDKELPFPTISFTWRHPGKKEMGTYEEYRMTLIDNLIASALSARLQERTLNPDNPYQFARAGLSNNMGVIDYDATVVAKSGKFTEATKVILEEIFRMKKYGFSSSELDRQKENILANYKSSYQERNKQESGSLSMELVRHFLQNEAVPGIEWEYAYAQKVMSDIKDNEIQNRINFYLNNDNFVSTVSLPAGGNTPSEEDVVKIYNEIKNSDIAAYNDKTVDKPLFDKDLTPGEIVNEDQMSVTVNGQKHSVMSYELSNGAKVLVKNTDFSDDEILFRAISNGGTSLINDEAFVSGRFSDNIVGASGISEFGPVELQKLMTGKNFRVSPRVSELNEGFSGNSNIEDFETMLQMLHLYFTNPRLDMEAFESWKNSRIDAAKNMKRNPSSVIRDSVGYIINNRDVRSAPVDEDYYKMVDAQKAFEIYKQRFQNPGDFTYIFVGNTDKVDFKQLIKKYIGSLEGSDDSEKWVDRGVRTVDGKLKKVFEKGQDKKSTVIIYFTNDDFDYSPINRHRISSMEKVLSIRLREQLREEKGGVYGVGVWSQMQKYPIEECSIGISFNCNPDRVDELLDDVKMIINEVKNETVSDENMKKVTETQKREFERALKENGSWLNWIYSSEWYGESLDRLARFDNLVESLTKEDINNSAKEYLDYDQYKLFILNPESN